MREPDLRFISTSGCWRNPGDALSFSIASPQQIIAASKGEVKNNHTLLSKTLRPIDHGLFCERIFGPINDWQCACNKYNGKKEPAHRGKICEQCQVEVVAASVRRQRMGHITLAAPVAHIWHFKEGIKPIGMALDLPTKQIEQIIYFQSYLVIDPKMTSLRQNQVLPIILTGEEGDDDISYSAATETHGRQSFDAKTGAEAIRYALSCINLTATIDDIELASTQTTNKQKLKKLHQRLQLLQSFQDHKVRPEWMVLTVLPVLPAGLRPVIPISGNGKYVTSKEMCSEEVERAYQEMEAIDEFVRRLTTAKNNNKSIDKLIPFKMERWLALAERKRNLIDSSGISDLNELYSRVIKQNNRLKDLLADSQEDAAVDINVEKHKLQAAVDALLHVRNADRKQSAGQPEAKLRSFSENLKGKTGRFRKNLLGKRVDYSGRSVIVVGPELKLHQCGLPKKMALVLFEPFIIHQLKKQRLVKTTHEGKKWIDRQPTEIWGLIAEIMRRRLVLLNRAPTLHRLSIQAFEPLLIEGDAIRLHPLSCAAYNADFDGDQMAVHVPLSNKALDEVRSLMLATDNILSPASGKPIVTPSQDIVLGCFYLTLGPRRSPPIILAELPLFGSLDEALMAYGYWSVKKPGRRLNIHDWIRLVNPDFGRSTIFGDAQKKIIVTTVGRVMFNEIWPSELGFYNQAVKKSDLSDLIGKCHQYFSHTQVVTMLDKLKEVGFQAATRAGISIGIDDMLIPAKKEEVIAAAKKQIKTNEDYYEKGIITDKEKIEKNQDVWRQCSNQVTSLVENELKNNHTQEHPNPLWLMLSSGARGSRQQIVQLTGMRGLMVKTNGEVMEKPILANFREGLTALEFFSSCYGARKGTSDTSLKTANAGHLTRKLVSVATDVVITANDCGTSQGREFEFTRQIAESPDEFAKRIGFVLIGRVAKEAINSPMLSGMVLVAANQEINEAAVKVLAQTSAVRVKIRTVLTCECVRGVCAQCYGRDLATSKPVKLGAAVGIIAAQSIGEPGTQLTMRTFHTGGTASDNGDITGGLPVVNAIFEAHRPTSKAIFTKIGGVISLENNDHGKLLLMVTNDSGDQEGYKIQKKTRVIVRDGDTVLPSQRLTVGDIDPRDFIAAFGSLKFMEQLVDRVQKIFQIQGVSIQQKHFEIIARQMTSCVRITNPGDTSFVLGEVMNRAVCQEKNALVASKGGQSAEAAPVLLGISQVVLKDDSFLSAASFERTTEILSKAAVLSSKEKLTSIKACVMTGKLIPAGTGFKFDSPTPEQDRQAV